MDDVDYIEPDAEHPGSLSTPETQPADPLAAPDANPGASDLPPPTAGQVPGFGQPPPEPHPARWARSEDRVVLGVAGGLGNALGLDPLIVRLAFVAVTALSPAGIPAYLAGWLLLRPAPFAPPVSRLRTIGGSVLAIIAALGLLSNDGPMFGGSVLLAAVLIGVAFAIWGPRRSDRAEPIGWRQSAEGVQAGLRGAVDGIRHSGDAFRSDAHVGPATQYQWQPPAPRPRRPRSIVGGVLLATAVIAGVVVFVLGGRDAEAATRGFGTAAAVFAIGFVVGLFTGRSRWLILPGLLCGAGALVTDAIDWAGVPFTTSGVDGYETPRSASDVEPSYRYGGLDFTLDLTEVTDDVTTRIEGGAGEIVVIVPRGARVEVAARVGFGNIIFPERGDQGGRRVSLSDTFGPESGHRIVLDLAVGFGQIDVRQADARPPLDGTEGTSMGEITMYPGFMISGDGRVEFDDGSVRFPDGSIDLVSPVSRLADGTIVLPSGLAILPNGQIRLLDGSLIDPSPGGGPFGEVISPLPTTAPPPLASTIAPSSTTTPASSTSTAATITSVGAPEVST